MVVVKGRRGDTQEGSRIYLEWLSEACSHNAVQLGWIVQRFDRRLAVELLRLDAVAIAGTKVCGCGRDAKQRGRVWACGRVSVRARANAAGDIEHDCVRAMVCVHLHVAGASVIAVCGRSCTWWGGGPLSVQTAAIRRACSGIGEL